MGIAGLTYVGLLVTGTIVGQAINESFRVAHILGMTVWCSLLTWLPILWFPALVSVKRLTRYNAPVNAKPPEESTATHPTSD